MDQQIAQQADQQGQQVVPTPEPSAELQPVPATSWNPPGADVDFDNIFARVGADGESIADSNAISVEPTTEPTEPEVAQPKAPEPRRDEFFLKTEGTVYKTREDAVKGVQQKDQVINQLRSMISAVTGEDPLTKSGSKPGQTTASQQPVSYLKDSSRYAEDLTKAAELGQKTGNWDPYRNVQAQLQYEIVQSTVGPYMPVVQNVGKQQALEDVSRNNPEFRQFYNSESYHKVLESRPKLAGMIQFAETQPTLQEELRELYQSVWDTSQATKLPELIKQNQHPQNTPQPRMPMAPVARPSLQVPDQRRPAESIKPSLSTPEGRRAIIEEAERKGVADVRF